MPPTDDAPTFDATCAAVCRAMTNFASSLMDQGLDGRAVIAGVEAALAGLMASLPEELVQTHVAEFAEDVAAVRRRLSAREEIRDTAKAKRH